MSVVPFPGDALLDAPGDGLLLSASGEAVAPRLHDVGTAAGIWQAAAQAAQPPAGISFGAAVSASASVLTCSAFAPMSKRLRCPTRYMPRVRNLSSVKLWSSWTRTPEKASTCTLRRSAASHSSTDSTRDG